MKTSIISTGICIILLLTIVTPMTLGYNTTKNQSNDYCKRYLYPEYYDCYSTDEIDGYGEYQDTDVSGDYELVKSSQPIDETPLDGPPMNSSWPMYCHDVRHTGQSPYITIDTTGNEKWEYNTGSWIYGSPVIDDQGILYIGADALYSVYPNGSLKWKFEMPFWIESAPAIDENGVIYVGTVYASPNYLYAIYTSNGTLKWKYRLGSHIASSPAIGCDGTIYCGCYNGDIFALNPNGTLKWKYTTENYVLSSPAIGDDGTIYCGSHDYHLYAFYPNNGTLKWKFQTGYYIRVSPCIADDGTIYCVSRDGNLYAVNPNGTLKWKTDIGAGTSPTISQDGTIYAGWKKLYAVNPTEGSVKWIFDPGPDRTIQGGTPCNSVDGTIYFGTSEGGELIAVNPDGTQRWRQIIANKYIESAPAIGEDGTVYIGSSSEYTNDAGYVTDYGCLMAIRDLDPNAPLKPNIDGPTRGKAWIEYTFKFITTSPVGKDVYYFVDWGDGKTSWWIGPFASGEKVTLKHKWLYPDSKFLIRVKTKDTDGLFGPMKTLEFITPRNKVSYNSLFLRVLERFPFLERLLNLLR